jgi:ATP-dependent Clp protease adapter protein ClpS
MKSPGRGYYRALTLAGVPVFIHWSVLGGVAFLCVVFLPDLQRALCVMLGYVTVIVVHEAGHAGAGWLLGLKVHSVQVSAGGGVCVLERPRRVRDGVFVHAAGVLAQLALLLATLSLVMVWGMPGSVPGSSLFFCFTIINGALIVINLIPFTIAGGAHSDGGMLWRLYLHRFRGHPHPIPPLIVAPPEQSPVFDAQTRLAEIPGLLPAGFIHGIEIHNDRTTPMELVLSLFERHLALSRSKALALMLKIHNEGGVLYPLPDAPTAERIAELISAGARQQGHTLLCRACSINGT